MSAGVVFVVVFPVGDDDAGLGKRPEAVLAVNRVQRGGPGSRRVFANPISGSLLAVIRSRE